MLQLFGLILKDRYVLPAALSPGPKALCRISSKINSAIRLVYKDYTSSFDELLFKDNSFRIHHRNLQKLAIEIFKVKLGIAPDIMKNVFPIIENPYDLRNETKFKSRNVNTVRYSIFQEVTKNVVLLTNLKQKLNFGIQKTAHANFVKITSIK